MKWLDGNKKFWMTIVGYVCATVGLALGKLDATLYWNVMQWLTIFGVGGNVAEKIVKKVGKRGLTD